MATIYYTGCTLDGFIATDDHSLDWLTSRDIDMDGPMGYPGFRERSRGLRHGRHHLAVDPRPRRRPVG